MTGLGLVGLNAWLYTALVLYSLVAIPLLSLGVAVRAPWVSRRTSMRHFRRAIRWYGYGIIHGVGFPWIRVRFEDASGDGGAGPFVFVCNHNAASDPFLMACIAHEGVQIAKGWPLRLPVWGAMARWAGYFSADDMPTDVFLARARRLLDEGVSLVTFPEGTRSQGRGIGAFHSAAFRLALQMRVDIAPICIRGNERMPPRGSGLLRPGRVRIRRLPTLPWAACKDLTPFQLKTRVRKGMVAAWSTMAGDA